MSEVLIVVPLDGSELSEMALPYAVTIAKATDAGLLLVTVWEEGERALISGTPDTVERIIERGEAHWREYADGIAERVRAEGVPVEAEVVIGEPADEILHVIDQRDPRLLVMATHGRSGLGRWTYGSVASKVVHEASAPTLIVGPNAEEGRAGGGIQRILVPLDGSEFGEAALRPALELAEAFDAELVLAQAVSWAGQTFFYGIPDDKLAEIDSELDRAAREYLTAACDGLNVDRPVHTRVLRGPRADALLTLVEAERIDLVVMASHTRMGLSRAVLGSTADRMFQAKAPVLLIRPEEPASVVRQGRGRYCHSCGRGSAYFEPLPDDRCRRCGAYLRACANCVYYDGAGCLLKRPEVNDAEPGRNCAYFQFRETSSPAEAMAGDHGRAETKA